jgi:hypothetical protein
VFLGHLEGSSHQICLKLFDERLFPMPEHPDYGDDSAESPEERLLDLNFVDDMMCREEAVYNDRLRHLQGSMIPHCYGFHMVGDQCGDHNSFVYLLLQFTLPDEWEVYGFFMEFVQGPTLFSYLPQIQMDKECLRVLVRTNLISFQFMMAEIVTPATSKADSFPSRYQSNEIRRCSSR